MIFEFTSKPNFDFIAEFSAQFDIPVFDNCLTIPASMGKGYIKKIVFGTDFRLIIHRYKLNEDFTIKRNASLERNDLISIFFYNNENLIDLVYNQDQRVPFSQNNESAIQLTTSDMNSVIKFPANSEIYKCIVGITSEKLATLLRIEKPNSIIQKITSGKDSFTYFESMNQEMLRNLKQLFEINVENNLSNFYYQIKVQELLYHLFDKLLQRVNLPHQLINNADVEKLLVLRNIILEDLSKPPVLGALSKLIGMSETKMKQLFKQTFGDTIYNYYQKIRMEEAAFLLKQAGYSVSDVGYQLGFSNLSHFSRLFEKQFGITPKKYSVVG
ncbi:AraC family transcriptional regulator [Chryseobacterium luteum]|uniref:AraC family transcriptional regulator n=2 Tax=Chryseobacterium luteum TaxID=421531 RepID=A0A085ZEA9_9FLAO|nr:AraC family transcriptional regulator [Chryseobacterium luteum]